MTLHLIVHPVCRLGSKSQAKKKGVKSNLRKEFDRMATSGGWDNDDEDDEQNDSAEEMDIDQAVGGSAAASGILYVSSCDWDKVCAVCCNVHSVSQQYPHFVREVDTLQSGPGQL